MAGIGFALKKLTSKDDLLGIARAYGHAAMASTGPWLATVVALAIITLPFSVYYPSEETLNFRVIVIYNFAFSLVFSAPIYMLITRYLADTIHAKNVTETPTVFLQSLSMLYAIILPVGALFYLGYVNLDLGMRLSAMANLFLIAPIWLIGVFLTALKDYLAVSRNFIIGMALAAFLALALKESYGAAGMLNGFSVGLAYIFYSMTAKVLAEYPYSLQSSTGLRTYFRKYWELAVAGVFYNAAIWADKWVMWWFAPEAEMLASKMVTYPDYDSAMFLAYLTIVPAMAIFVFSVETNFFMHYKKFYYDILEHKPLQRIRENHRNIVTSLLRSARNFIVVQGTISFVAVLLAAKIFEMLNINYLQIGIFRLGVLGAFFHVLMLFEMIILSYFDCRRSLMVLQGVLLALNVIFTLLTIQLGFPYYGFGYFLSALLTFALTSVVLFNHIQKLPYHAFITNNNSLRRAFMKKADAQA